MKPFKKTILHVGPDKTGSTAIQTACNTLRNLLFQHGVYYPSGQWHAELGSCFCDYPEQYIFNSLSGYKDRDWIKARDILYLEKLRMELEQASGNIVIFSYEGFVDLDITALSRFKEFIEEYSDDCEVVFYVRSPFSYAVSAMSQRVKSGIYSWADNDSPISPTRDFLEKLSLVFGKEHLNVRRFSRETLPQGDVVLDFFGLFDFPIETSNHQLGQRFQNNRSLSAEALLIGDKIIEGLAGRLTAAEFYDSFGNILESIRGGKIKLNAQQTSDVAQASQVHLDYLAEVFDITFESEFEGSASEKNFIAQDSFTSLANVLTNLVLPETKPLREYNSALLLMHSAELRQGHVVECGQVLIFDVDFFVNGEISELEMGIHIFDAQGRWAFGTNSTLLKKTFRKVTRGSYKVSHYLIADLPTGRYTAGFAFADKGHDEVHELAWRDAMCEFVVVHSTQEGFVGYSSLPAEISLQPTTIANDSLLVQNPVGSIEPVVMPYTMRLNEQTKIVVKVSNTGNELWLGDSFRPVNVSYHWNDEAGNSILTDGLRTRLREGGIAPHSTVELEVELLAPASPGRYCLMLTLVQEFVSWFEELGFTPTVLDVLVTE